MHRNTTMYGFADLEAYTAGVQASSTYCNQGLSAVVCDEIAAAEQAIELDPAGARQALNRARFLIARLCPLGREARQETAAV